MSSLIDGSSDGLSPRRHSVTVEELLAGDAVLVFRVPPLGGPVPFRRHPDKEPARDTGSLTQNTGRPSAPSSSVAGKAIPFDHAFRYQLQGKPGNVLNSIVSVSIEAMFTAVSIGYGVVSTVQPIVFGPAPEPASESDRQSLLSITLEQIFDGLESH